MSDYLSIKEIGAWLHPHSHKYDLLHIANEINDLLKTGTAISMIDIDALAKGHKLAKKYWGKVLGPDRFRIPEPDYSRYHSLGYTRPGTWTGHIPVVYDEHGLPVISTL